ncbi:MAG: hypothetical protein GX418_06675 [Clostridiales bacterium]|nr:hypothetical protein [Clostridiales bacterium]
MERFLRYSLDKGRKIRVVLLQDGALRQTPATVLALNAEEVTLQTGAKKTPLTVRRDDILSCDYARGDHGED